MAGTVGTVPSANLLPAEFTTTHDTDGLPGWGALDWMRPAGTIVGSPVGGTVERTGGSTGTRGAGVYGRNVYLKTDSGQRLFLTHFSDIFVRDRQRVQAGDPLGRVAPYGNASHIHIAAQGAADKGAKVDLEEAPSQGGKPDGGTSVLDIVTSPFGLGWGRGGKQVSEIDSVWDWTKEYGVRGVQVTLGFVILIVGLVLLGKHLGAPAPEHVPLPGGRDLYQSKGYAARAG